MAHARSLEHEHERDYVRIDASHPGRDGEDTTTTTRQRGAEGAMAGWQRVQVGNWEGSLPSHELVCIQGEVTGFDHRLRPVYTLP